MKISFMSLLFVLFLGLKLCHVIDWSWWFITGPIWIPSVLSFLLQTIVKTCIEVKKEVKKGLK